MAPHRTTVTVRPVVCPDAVTSYHISCGPVILRSCKSAVLRTDPGWFDDVGSTIRLVSITHYVGILCSNCTGELW